MCGIYDWFFTKIDPAFRFVLGALFHLVGWIFFICGCIYLNNGEISAGGATMMLLIGLGMGTVQSGAILYLCGACQSPPSVPNYSY